MARVTVLYFASVRERLGLSEERLELPDRTSDREVLARLAERHPPAAALFASARLAVDQDIVRGDCVLRAGAELAVIPPVSGG
jgi:molybdopterin synthase catalytic subunit